MVCWSNRTFTDPFSLSLGYTFPLKLCPLPTRRPPVRLALRRFVQVVRVLTVLLAVTETTTARKRTLPQTTIPNSPALVGVVPERKSHSLHVFSFSNMYNAMSHAKGLYDGHETTCDNYF